MSRECAYFSSPPRVLVVHPDSTVRSELCQLLEFAEFLTEQTLSVDDARLRIASQAFELIILEVGDFPNSSRDSQSLVSLIKELPHYDFVPLVSVSADSSAAGRAFDLGLDLFVPLPIDREAFPREIRRLYRRFADLERKVAEEQHQFRQNVLRTLSHEFRTPLVGMTVGVELLEDAEEIDKSPKLKKVVKTIRSSSERLRGLVMDFLLAQQIEAGAAKRSCEAHRRSLAVGGLVANFFESQKAGLEARGFSIQLVDRTEEGYASVCDQQIYQILERLVSNAVKFSKDRKEICFVVAPSSNDGISIAIADRGIGIGDNSEEAFKPFSQPGREILEQQGSGLGLWVARGLTQINGGQLHLHPREGGGTIAEILFDSVSADA